MILDHFKRKKYDAKKNIKIKPDGIIKCPACEKMIFKGELNKYRVCNYCGNYFKMSALERIDSIADNGTFVEYFKARKSKNPLNFPGYDQKQEELKKNLRIDEAVISGICKIDDRRVVIVAMDTHFMMGSMGVALGEKVTKSIELSMKKKIPIIIFSASGGARMQEGMFSLMQMAKTSQAIGKHREKGLLSICVMTDPTTGGVSASFASLGDVIIGEKGALIGFAGPRVISQVTGTILPDGFQRADFLLEHGLLDMVVAREDMKSTLTKLLDIFVPEKQSDKQAEKKKTKK